MKYKILPVIIFIFLFSMPMVLAVPIPFSETTTTGFDIKYPPVDTIIQYQDYEFEFHVFNKTNGVPVYADGQSEISCYFHLYNSSGNHIAEMFDATPSHTFDYTFLVNGANFSQLGPYSYIVQCNSSNQGGFDSVPFRVTPTGQPFYTETANILIIGIIALMFIAIIFFVLALSIEIIPVRVFFLGLSALMVLMTIGMLSSIYYKVLQFTSIAESFGSIYILFTILTIGGGISLVLYILVRGYKGLASLGGRTTDKMDMKFNDF